MLTQFANAQLIPSHITATFKGGIAQHKVFGFCVMLTIDNKEYVGLRCADSEDYVIIAPATSFHSITCEYNVS